MHVKQPLQAGSAEHGWPDVPCKAEPHIDDVIYGSGGLPAHEVQRLPNAGGAVADSWPGHRGDGAPCQLVGWICSVRPG